jgi:hypothetical protein
MYHGYHGGYHGGYHADYIYTYCQYIDRKNINIFSYSLEDYG